VKRFSQLGIIAAIIAALVIVGAAQEASQPPQQPAPIHQDAPAPEPHPELKPLLEEARTLLNNDKFQDALSKADALLQQAKAKGDTIGEAYALHVRATALQEMRKTTPDQLPEVAETWASAFALWREIGDEAYQVEALLSQAYCLWRASPERAQALLQDALQLAKGEGKRPLALAQALNISGGSWYAISQPSIAETLWQQALAIQEKLAPNSLQLARTLNDLGLIALDQSNLSKAEQFFHRSLEICKKISPSSLDAARALNNLGLVALDRGDLAKAEQFYQKSLIIKESLKPESLAVAYTLGNLGILASFRGDQDWAEQLLKRAATIFGKLAPDSLDAAYTLNNLGTVSYFQGNLDYAEELYRQTLAIYEKIAPNSLEVAHSLHNLGNVALRRGDLGQAEQLFQRALDIKQAVAPGTLDIAYTLQDLANLAFVQNRMNEALNFLNQARIIVESVAPSSLQHAFIIQTFALLAREQRNYPQAQQYLARALEIYETQRTVIPDPETKTAFAERYFNAYTLQAQLAFDQNQPQQAALALEPSRARTLAELLYTRTPPVPADAPQALRDLIAQQEQLQRDQLLLARQQRQTDPNDQDAVQRLQAQSRALADRQRQLDQLLRQQFPAYANLLNPQPPSLQQVQAALDANTVLLYHAFADKELLIVAVSRQAVQSYRVKVDVRALEKDLTEFQHLVAKPPLMRTALERRKLLALGRRLYALLVKPAEASLKNATTVLLCPEGVLNLLPWGALVVAVDTQGRPTYWIERVAIGVVPSAGVYRQARATRPAPRGVAIAAVSQYSRQQAAQASTVAQLVRRSGRALGDLPAVRQEVAQLRRELSKLGVVIAQESNATPARARQMAQNARVVHFACHARADNVDPLGSGLLLAPAGSDEGLLTAAEVVSRWRLRADVVMLSACETAVGVSRRYEGLYGLARAFLFAGARSVGASLWQVSDASTARLMGAFYREYARGVGKAEALRRAQVELLRDKRYADPYYWSCFVLMGAER